MAKKKADIIEIDTARAPNFSTSASIESGLADFLFEVESCCGGAFKLTFARSAENHAQDALYADEKKRKGYDNADTGLVATLKNAVTGKTDRVHVSSGMLENWIDTYAPLAKSWGCLLVPDAVRQPVR